MKMRGIENVLSLIDYFCFHKKGLFVLYNEYKSRFAY